MRRMYSPDDDPDSLLMTCDAEVEEAVFTTTRSDQLGSVVVGKLCIEIGGELGENSYNYF